MGSNDTIYPRLRIHGHLTCRSPLHIGSGDSASLAERTGDEKDQGDYGTVCTGLDEKPYLPASALRGFLRARCVDADLPLALCLFGHVEGDGGRAGRLRVRDARLRTAIKEDPGNRFYNARRNTLVRHQVALNPITGAVATNLLFQTEHIPTGSVFDWVLEADDLDRETLGLILGLLQTLDGKPDAGVGRGRGRLQGRLEWILDRVDALDEQQLLAWLDDPAQRLNEAFKALYDPPPPAGAHFVRPATLSIALTLIADGPLLVNDPGHAAREGEELPDLEFSRDAEGHALIPASSLRGVLRARARRIAMTIAGTYSAAPEPVVDTLIGELFGTTTRRSPIWIGDARADKPSRGDSGARSQQFVAIDRFTSGSARQKLYQANAAVDRTLSTEIHLEPGFDLASAYKGLLLLLAIDALDGELCVGWGKARGYGRLDVVLKAQDGEFRESQQLCDRLAGQTDSDSWIRAVHERLGLDDATEDATPDEEKDHA